MYNMKIKYFVDGSFQIQVYKKAILTLDDKSFTRIDPSTGEIVNGLKPAYVPFYPDHITYCREKRVVSPEEYVARSMRRTVNQVYDYARSNVWDWFLTLTFSPDKVNRYDYSECSKKLSNWLTYVRRCCSDVRYLVVAEQHKDGAWHFHGLFSGIESMSLVDSGLIDNKGRVIFNVGKYRLGFSTATRISDMQRVSSYICKYITKELCLSTKGRKRYWISRNLNKPQVIYDYSPLPFQCRIFKLRKNSPYVKACQSAYNDVLYIEK